MFNELKEIIRDYIKIFKKYKFIGYITVPLILSAIFGVILLVIVLNPYIQIYDYIKYKEYESKTISHGSPEKDEYFNNIKRGTLFNPGYIKMFLSLKDLLTDPEDVQEKGLIEQFSNFESFMFPIFYNNFPKDDLIKIEKICGRENIALFCLYRGIYQLKHAENESNTYIYDSLYNTNYSQPVEDIDIAANALSSILDIDPDGINKVVYVKKDNLKEILFCDLDDFVTVINSSRNINDVVFNKLNSKKDAYYLILEFLSLCWRTSSQNIYKTYKDLSKGIREKLYKYFEKNDKKEYLSLFDLVGYRDPSRDTFFRAYKIKPPTEEKRKRLSDIKSNIFKYTKEEIYDLVSVPSPKFSASDASYVYDDKITIDEINNLKKQRVSEELETLQNADFIDYKSRMFMICSTKIFQTILGEKIQLQNKYSTYPKNYSEISEIELEEIMEKKRQEFDKIKDTFDFSPAVLGYTKFFEKTINSSIVQLIRKELGVEMPKYFLKYCDIKGEYVVRVHKDFIVNFNMKLKNSNKYFSPGLGQSSHAFSKMPNHIKEQINESKDFLNSWKSLTEIRNRMAHEEIINEEEALQVKEIMARLFMRGNLFKLISIKNDLQMTAKNSFIR